MDPRDTSPTCPWCGRPLPPGSTRHHRRTCSKLCRQALWRFHVAPGPTRHPGIPRHFAYADPPYPGKAHLYPEHREVDHCRLITYLETHFPDGWALSTSASALRDILPLCPHHARVCAWLKKARPHPHARILTTWEPLIIRSCRDRIPLDRAATTDALIARGRFRAFPGALIGMKPPAYATWLFQLLGACRGDTLADLFPGSGAVARAATLYGLHPHIQIAPGVNDTP